MRVLAVAGRCCLDDRSPWRRAPPAACTNACGVRGSSSFWQGRTQPRNFPTNFAELLLQYSCSPAVLLLLELLGDNLGECLQRHCSGGLDV